MNENMNSPTGDLNALADLSALVKRFALYGQTAELGLLTLAITEPDGGAKGAGGISMLLVPGDAADLSRSPLQKIGGIPPAEMETNYYNNHRPQPQVPTPTRT